jgi:CubicO group peptidase (beta-lactamase class C family)
MRKALVVIGVLLGVGLLAMKPLLNLSPLALGSAAEVAAGLGAKLGCSGRYITGLSPAQLRADLASYSPAFSLVDVSYDEAARRSSANLFGMAEVAAQYRPGLGCTLALPGAERLDTVQRPSLANADLPWPRGERADAIDPAAQAALDTLMAADNAAGYQSRALLVVRDGQLIAESYAAEFDAATAHLGWSMGKSVTAMLLGLLETDRVVSASEQELFAQWQADERADISLENLLQMASGLAFDEEYTPGSDATRMLAAEPSAAGVALSQPAIYAPGEHFAYSSGTTNMLALLYQQRVGGTTQAAVDYLSRRLLQPLAMHNTIVEPDPSGVFVGSSYVYATARDWARLGLLMLDKGEFNGQQLLSADWVARAQRPNRSSNDPRYGYQFWLNGGGDELRWPQLPVDAYAMLGNRSQVVMIIPSRNMVIVRLGWSATSYPTSTKLATLLSDSA